MSAAPRSSSAARPSLSPERFFAPCPRGLEPPLAAELAALGAADVDATDGGVGFGGDFALAYRANLESRIASRVLWRVGAASYGNERDISAAVSAIAWPGIFAAQRTIRVDVAATRSPLTSLDFVTLSVKDAVCDRFRADTGIRPSVDKRAPDVRIQLHLTDREATIYVDTSGEPLFKRGWREQPARGPADAERGGDRRPMRVDTGTPTRGESTFEGGAMRRPRRETDEAPLRENLAAGLLALAGWTPGTPLLDPMCGGGTIVVEAALIAADRAPGLARTFGFQKLAWYDGPTWQRIRQAAHDRIKAAPGAPSIFASDVAPEAVAKCLANLAAAKVADFVHVERADVLTRAAPAATGCLIANPPYGVRLEDQARMAAFYPRLGDALKQRFAGWTAWLFTGDLRLAKLIRLSVTRRIPLYNGAIECRLFALPLHTGSRRERPAADGAPVVRS